MFVELRLSYTRQKQRVRTQGVPRLDPSPTARERKRAHAPLKPHHKGGHQRRRRFRRLAASAFNSERGQPRFGRFQVYQKPGTISLNLQGFTSSLERFGRNKTDNVLFSAFVASGIQKAASRMKRCFARPARLAVEYIAHDQICSFHPIFEDASRIFVWRVLPGVECQWIPRFRQFQ